MHDYAWLCMIMYDYAWLCMIMHNYGWLCKLCIIMHNYAKMSSLRFCHERGQNKRWGAVRHVIVSGILMRVFFIFIFSQKKRLSDVWTFHVFSAFFLKKTKRFDPKVPQKCLGGVWDHPRRIRDQFWTISDQHRLKHYICKNTIKKTIHKFKIF